ncbi:mediator of RNA polymerase II transcription subunit 21 [Aspergillus udagawae]|uniref:Mediator of RNA polymerase II transcription subunit 21 n=1 Tax=Aspergillus udagawae TaxID=91492 RepID=A0A8H3NKS9_9EURO|nr:mediator of RNA polymerase II transcription subunit 21 [Aspergillus udagawae]
MADILTQLQTCLDQVPHPSTSIPQFKTTNLTLNSQLATQFYATIGYLSTYHDNSPAIPPADVPDAAPALAKIPKNSTAPPVPAGAPVPAQFQASPPAQNPAHGAAGAGTSVGEGGQTPGPAADPNLPAPDSPRTFASRQRELARDLIIKEQQIEYLISVLPGIDSSEAEQEKRIRELESELRRVEEERELKMRELKRLRRTLENVLRAVETGIYGDRALLEKYS